MQTIGSDFKKFIIVNLIPGVDLPLSYWQVDFHYMTDSNGLTTYNAGSFNAYSQEESWYVKIGQDVRDISITIHRHKVMLSKPTPNFIIHYKLRVDQLLMLNIAHRLLGSKVSHTIL